MATERIVKGALPRVDWGAVITGVLCAVAIHVVLGLFGTAFGLAAQPADSTGMGVGAGIWALLAPLVASGIGAFIAVRIAQRDDAAGAHLHGALVWAIGLIAGALFITGTMATSAMTSATATSGNVRGGLSAAQARNPVTGARAEDAAKAAAEVAGAGGLGALLGLAGAFLGAAAGRRALTGEGFGAWRRSSRGAADRERQFVQERSRREERYLVDDPVLAHRENSGTAARMGDAGRGGVIPPDDPTLHH